MRAVVQRVAFADVTVFDSEEVAWAAMENGTYDEVYNPPDPLSDELYTGREVGRIPYGLVVFLGVEVGDTENDATYMADKICGLRIFEDSEGKMNLSLLDCCGSGAYILAVSQFTLLGDVRKGKRPSFTTAEKPERANELYRDFVDEVTAKGIYVEEGEFQTDMLVRIHNQGPVTILIDSRKAF